MEWSKTIAKKMGNIAFTFSIKFSLGILLYIYNAELKAPIFGRKISDLFSRNCANFFRFFALPPIRSREFFISITPRISVAEKFFVAVTEELYFRGLIQQVALPKLSNLLPSPFKNIFNHKITRIFLTSTLFALSHTNHWDTDLCLLPQFFGGVSYGILAESDGLGSSIAAHFIYNAYLNFLENLI